jgi:DNA-binding MarR family transcriptional regulator
MNMHEPEAERHEGSAGPLSALTERLLALSRALSERLEAAAAAHGVSLAKLQVLQVLVAAGEPLPLGVLTQRLGCARSNVTRLMDGLEADGLVHRAPDARDRRSVRARLTSEGGRRCVAATAAVAAAETEFLGRLPAEARAMLRQALARISPDPAG